MSDDFWVIQWRDPSADCAPITETAESAEEVVEILRRLLEVPQRAGTFQELFRGAPPVALLSHVRGVVEFGSRAGTLVLTRTRVTRQPVSINAPRNGKSEHSSKFNHE